MGGVAAFSLLPRGAHFLPHGLYTQRLLLGERQAEQWLLAIVRLDNHHITRIPLPFMPHTYVQDPLHTHRVWAIEKWGPHAALVDVKDAKILQHIEPPKDTLFLGHGFFVPAQRTMFFSCTNRLSTRGGLFAVDADSVTQRNYFTIAPGHIHESKLLFDGTAMVASSGVQGGSFFGSAMPEKRVESSSLIRCDLSSGEVLNKISITDTDHTLTHFSVLTNDNIIALSIADDVCAIYAGNMHEPVMRAIDLGTNFAQQKLSETLSIAVDESTGLAIITSTDAASLLMLDVQRTLFHGTAQVGTNIYFRSMAFDDQRSQFIAGSHQGLYAIPADVTPETLPARSQLIVKGDFGGAHSMLISV